MGGRQPLPVSGTLSGEVGALLLMVKVPDSTPMFSGLKRSWMMQVPFGAIELVVQLLVC